LWILCQINTSFLLSSLFVAAGLLPGGCLQGENKKETATLPEANKKNVHKTRGFLTCEES
jgi:hypothetical protein